MCRRHCVVMRDVDLHVVGRRGEIRWEFSALLIGSDGFSSYGRVW